MTRKLEAIGAIGGAIGSIGNAIGNAWGVGKSNTATKKMARESNLLSAQMANQEMAFQEQMSNTAIQRQVADAKMAGVNPLFAVGGGGASSPSGAMGSTTSGGAMQAPKFDMDIGGAISAYSRIKTEKAQRKIMEEQAKNEVKTGNKIDAETNLAKATTNAQINNSAKTKAEAIGINADNTLRQLKSDSIQTARNVVEDKGKKTINEIGSILQWNRENRKDWKSEIDIKAEKKEEEFKKRMRDYILRKKNKN